MNLSSNRQLSRALLGVVGLSCFLLGCGGDQSKPADKKMVYTASGSLLINGKPSADAWVTLVPTFEGVPAPMSRTGVDGSFTTTVYDQDIVLKEADPEGEYHVTVTLPKDPTTPLSPDQLGGAYSDPEKSKFLVTIKLGENKLEPIRIENAQTGTAPGAAE